MVRSSRAGEERGSDRAGADGRADRRALPWELRQGELVFSSSEIAFFSRGVKFTA